MTDLEIQEQAEKILQEYKGDSCYIHEDDAIGAMNDLVKLMQEQYEWIAEIDLKPKFGVPVMVYCRIYGRAIYTYENLDEGNEKCIWGNWHDGKQLGVLPPTHWQPLPSPPKTK